MADPAQPAGAAPEPIRAGSATFLDASDYLHVAAMKGAVGELGFTSRRGIGQIWIDRGFIMGARVRSRAGALRGRDAALEICRWSDCQVGWQQGRESMGGEEEVRIGINEFLMRRALSEDHAAAGEGAGRLVKCRPLRLTVAGAGHFVWQAERVIGRGPESDVVIEDARVSRRHCMIRPDGQDYFVIDMGSSNGTAVIEEGAAPDRIPVWERVLLPERGEIDVGGVRVPFEVTTNEIAPDLPFFPQAAGAAGSGAAVTARLERLRAEPGPGSPPAAGVA